MSLGYLDDHADDRIVIATQAEAKQAIVKKLLWHLERKPDLTLTGIMALFSVSLPTAKRYRKWAKEAQQ